MPLEATMIIVDNSDYMRNGDYPPSRMVVQNESVNIVCQSKRQSNAENTVGLITLADSNVLTTLTSEFGKINQCLHQINHVDATNFSLTILKAHLALKHRQVRNQKMKIIAFIGSPILDSQETLVKLAKKLRKENVSVDIISFGETQVNQEKLNTFIENLNTSEGNTSNLVIVPPGTNLKDSLRSSPIMGDQSFAGMVDNGENLDIDGTEDPDLLYALRVSMEDQRMRQQAENSTAPTAMETSAQPDLSAMTEEEQLNYAIKMSMDQEASKMETGEPSTQQPNPESMEPEFLDKLIEEEGEKKKEDKK